MRDRVCVRIRCVHTQPIAESRPAVLLLLPSLSVACSEHDDAELLFNPGEAKQCCVIC